MSVSENLKPLDDSIEELIKKLKSIGVKEKADNLRLELKYILSSEPN